MEESRSDRDLFEQKISNLGSSIVERNDVVPDKFGLCSTCGRFNYISFQYGREKFNCNGEYTRYFPDGNEPISKCTSYFKRGEMSLYDMNRLAVYIDPDKKSKTGF